ncbi:MAG TPA: hypothetical protein PLD25_22900 [Chloroflexota bacterium]|nr:hypothetical protein [Chloroflexota bacterium]
MSKNQLNLSKALLLGFLLLLLTLSCQPTAKNNNQTVVATLVVPISSEAAMVLPTSTPVSLSSNTTTSITPTWTPTSSPTISLISELTSTPLPTETSTPTPWPPISPDEAANKVLALLTDNQNPDCLLPCWWGATPGVTRWQDIEPFLNSLAREILYSSSGDSFGAEVIIPLPESVDMINSSDYHAFYGWNESGVIHGIQVAPTNISGFDATTMLTRYGVPYEVWLTTLDEPREGVLPFQLIIVYQRQGFSLHYYVDATRNSENVTVCFESGAVEEERPDMFPAAPRIYLWEPGQKRTIQQISPVPLERYFPLETKTDLTPQTLYEKFTNPDEPPCIDTPADLWKY